MTNANDAEQKSAQLHTPPARKSIKIERISYLFPAILCFIQPPLRIGQRPGPALRLPCRERTALVSSCQISATVSGDRASRLLLWRSDLTALGQAFARISAGPVIAGLCLVQLQVILSALRWRFTAGRLGQVINAPRAIREYYVASLLNQSLPGGWAVMPSGPGACAASGQADGSCLPRRSSMNDCRDRQFSS